MIKLYEKNSQVRENITTVTSCTEVDGEYYITLAESIFFPEEGGQKADTGRLICGTQEIMLTDGQLPKGLSAAVKDDLMENVSNTSINGDMSGTPSSMADIIFYRTDKKVEAGTEVKCILDYEKRFDRMQNHSGEHILTGVIHRKYGLDNVGFHLSDEEPVTLDINGKLTYEQVLEMEKEANRVIYANMPIVDSYPSKEELADITYRSKIEIDGQVRLITIGDDNETVDICACCAPHVSRTGEVGIIKVVSVINWKGGIRISMLAGRRALEYISSEHELIKSMTTMLTTSADNILTITQNHIDEIGMLKSRLAASLEANVINRIDARIAQVPARAHAISNGMLIPASCVEFVDEDYPAASMKNIYNFMLTRYEGFVAVLAGDDEKGYRYFGGSVSRDSRELATALREKFGAKGGGKQDMVQGQIEAKKDDIISVIMEL